MSNKKEPTWIEKAEMETLEKYQKNLAKSAGGLTDGSVGSITDLLTGTTTAGSIDSGSGSFAIGSGTTTDVATKQYTDNWQQNGNIIINPGAGTGIGTSTGVLNTPYYDSSAGWQGNSDLDLDMDDFIELLHSSKEHRTDLLEAYARMIVDKLHSMPGNGGLEIPEGMEDFPVPSHVGEDFARTLAQAWGYPMCTVGSVRVYRDGTFKFKLKV